MDSFYKTNHVEDIDVLPLIKPYRLWSPVPDKAVWHLDFQTKVPVDTGWEIAQMQVCQINVVNATIYGHCTNMYNNTNASYFVVIPDQKVEKIFSSQQTWSAYLKERGINSGQLHNVLDVYHAFKSNYKSLPWYTQIKGIR